MSKIAKTAVELAMVAMAGIDAMNEKETMRQAREDVKTIARLFGLDDPERLWRDACDGWYEIGRRHRENDDCQCDHTDSFCPVHNGHGVEA